MSTTPFRTDMRTFAKKGDAHAFFRDMLNRYTIGDRVSASDEQDLRALLKKHTQYVAKLGSGISHFEIMGGGYGTQCFKIIRVDGTSDDFSYKHCITPKSN